MAFYDSGNVQRGSISNTGATTTYATSSDQNWKDDKGELPAHIAADILRRIVIHSFTWKPEHGGTDDVGAFAQELYEVYPTAVPRRGGWLTLEGELHDKKKEDVEYKEYQPWQVDYSQLVPLLVVGWQDIDARLASLEANPHN